MTSDVLEAGAALGTPIPDESDPRLRPLKIVIAVEALLILAAVVAIPFAPTLKAVFAIAWAAGVLLVAAHAAMLISRALKLRTPAVGLFEDGFVYATADGLEAVPWSNVKLAYLTPGKRLLLQFEDGGTFELRGQVRNRALIESTLRTALARDKIRRGLPPKNLAAV